MIQPELAIVAGLAQALPDTVVAVQAVPAWRAWVDTLSAIATIVVAVALLALGGIVLLLMVKARKLIARAEEAARRLRIDVEPAVHNAIAVTENLNFISRTVRRDAERLSQTVNAANERVDGAIRTAERRVGELNALLEVVQEEAEDLFIGAASAARGVRAGTEALQRLQARDGDGARAALAGADEGPEDETYDGPLYDEEEDDEGEGAAGGEIDPDRVF